MSTNNIQPTHSFIRPPRACDARPSQQSGPVEQDRTHQNSTATTQKGSRIGYNQDRKLIGDLDVKRFIVLSKDNSSSLDSIQAGIKIARNEYGANLALNDDPQYMNGRVDLDISGLVQDNGNKTSALLDHIMEALIRDDSKIYTALHDNPDNEFWIHLNSPKLMRYTDEAGTDSNFKHTLTTDGVVNRADKTQPTIILEYAGVDEISDKKLHDEVQDKLDVRHEANIYVRLEQKTENIIVTGFDAKTGERYDATVPRASIIEAQKKAKEAAQKTVEATTRAAIKVVGQEAASRAAEIQTRRAATKAVGQEAASLAAETQSLEDADTLNKIKLHSPDNQTIETGVISPRNILEGTPSNALKRSTSTPDIRMHDDIFSGKPIQHSKSSPATLSGPESQPLARSESSHSVLNDVGFTEKHSHMTSDKRALLAIAALVVAGVATEAIGSAVAGSEAADAKDAADEAEQDAIANDPDHVAIANQEAQQAYADALNNGNPDHLSDPGLYVMYPDEDGTWFVKDEPTAVGQEEIDVAQERYDAAMATYHEKMAEHDKLLKTDMGKITTSIAGIFLGAAAGTAATKYILDVSHNHSGKHDVNGATPITVA